MPRALLLLELAGDYAVSRLAAAMPIPVWADGEGFVSISRTTDELSVVCLQSRVPADVRSDGPWVAFKLQGPFDFGETGIGAAILVPLAEAKIGIFFVSTFDTDYLLVKQTHCAQTIHELRKAGHEVLALEP